jgi:hypothetical protein
MKNAPPLNYGEAFLNLLQCCSACWLAIAALHGVLGAIGDRVHVASRTTNRVAGRGRKGSRDKRRRQNLLDHRKLLI